MCVCVCVRGVWGGMYICTGIVEYEVVGFVERQGLYANVIEATL